MAFRVLFLDTVHPILKEKLEKDGFKCKENLTCTAEELKKIIPKYQGLVLRSRLTIDHKILKSADNLKFIARSGSGLENIDTKYAEQNGILCFNSPEGNRDAVGEHALGMLLSLLNKISTGDKSVRQGIWNREANRGIEIGGKTVGIIGYGNTGSAFAEKLKGFNCKILAFDQFKIGFENDHVQEVRLKDLREQADIVSIHIPYNEANHHFVNKNFLSSFTKDIYLINTSRGVVLNTEDLVEKMKDGKVKGVCLDVFEFELPSFETMDPTAFSTSFSYLINSENCILTPHVAGWTTESYYKLSLVLYDKIKGAFPKKP